MRSAEERLRRPSTPVPPPRPSRRYPVRESRPPVRKIVSRPTEEPEQDYQRQRPAPSPPNRSVERSNNRYSDRNEPRTRNQARHPGEKEIFTIHPTFYPVFAAYFVSVGASLIVAAIVAYLRLSFWVALIFATIFMIPAIMRHIRLVHTVYTLTTTKVEVSAGLFSKISRNIPLQHIQDVSVSETFKERVLGIGDVIIDTAALDTTISLENIHTPRKYADLILDQLQRWDY